MIPDRALDLGDGYHSEWGSSRSWSVRMIDEIDVKVTDDEDVPLSWFSSLISVDIAGQMH